MGPGTGLGVPSGGRPCCPGLEGAAGTLHWRAVGVEGTAATALPGRVQGLPAAPAPGAFRGTEGSQGRPCQASPDTRHTSRAQPRCGVGAPG